MDLYKGHSRKELIKILNKAGFRGLSRLRARQLWGMYYAWVRGDR